MSTFDAGKIQASLDADRTPFQAQLRAAKSEAEDFAKGKYNAKLGVDTASASADIKKLRAELDALHDKTVKIKVDSSKAAAEAAAVGAAATKATKDAQKAAEDSKAAINPLMDAITFVGPALVPLAGGILGVSSALVGMGAVGILAFKGIGAEIKNNTALGGAYLSQLKGLQSEASTLESTAAKGVASAFSQITSKVSAKLPSLNGLIDASAPITGDIVSHLVGGAIDLLIKMEPLILTAEKEVDGLAQKFEKWAEGPGGEKFFATLAQEIPQAVDAIGALFSFTGKALAALNDLGGGTLGILTDILGFVGKLPTPVVEGFAIAWTAYRLSVIASTIVTKLDSAATGDNAKAKVAQAAASRASAGAAAEDTAAMVDQAAASRAVAAAAAQEAAIQTELMAIETRVAEGRLVDAQSAMRLAEEEELNAKAALDASIAEGANAKAVIYGGMAMEEVAPGMARYFAAQNEIAAASERLVAAQAEVAAGAARVAGLEDAQAAAAGRLAVATDAAAAAEARLAEAEAAAAAGGTAAAAGGGAAALGGGAAAKGATAGLGAEEAVGGAALGGGAMGALGTAAYVVAPVAIADVVAALGFGELAKATHDQLTSTNGLARVVAGTFQGLSDVAHLSFGKLFHDMGSLGESSSWANALPRMQAQINQYENDPSLQAKSLNVAQYPYVQKPQMVVNPLDISGYYSSSQYQYQAHSDSLVNAGLNSVGKGGVSQQSIDSLTQYGTALQKNIDAESAWVNEGQHMVQIAGLGAVGEQRWYDTLQATNGDYSKAINIIKSHVNVLTDDATAQARANQEAATTTQLMSDMQGKYQLSTQQVTLYSSALGLTAANLSTTTDGLNKQEAAIYQVSQKFINGDQSMAAWAAAAQTAMASVAAGTVTLADKASLLGSALLAADGNTLNLESTNLNAADSTEKLASTIARYSDSVGTSGKLLGQLTQTSKGYMILQPQFTAGSQQITNAMLATQAANIKMAQAMYDGGATAQESYKAYEGLREQLVSSLEPALGGSKEKADALATSVLGQKDSLKKFTQFLDQEDLPKAISSLTLTLSGLNTTLQNLGQYTQQTGLSGLYQDLLNIKNIGPINPSVVITGPKGTPILGPGLIGVDNSGVHGSSYADGGLITAGTGPRADDVLLRGSRGEYMVNAQATAKHFHIIDAINKGTKGFADGGAIGTSYGPSLIGSGGKLPSNVNASSSSSASAAKAAAAKAAAAIKAANTAFNNGIDSLINTLKGQDSTLANMIPTSMQQSQAQQSMQQLVSYLNQANKYHAESASFMKAIDNHAKDLANQTDALAKNTTKLATATQDLATAKQNYDSVLSADKTANMSGFNITTSGSGFGSGIMSSLTQAEQDEEKFRGLLKQAASEGYSQELLSQFEAAGAQASGKNLEALVASGNSGGYVQQLNSRYAQLGAIATSIGTMDAQAQYGAAVATATQQVATLTAQNNALQKRIFADVAVIRTEMVALEAKLTNAKRKV